MSKVEDYAVKLVPFDMAGMSSGPLQPIAATGGLVFPYTPTVDESVAINYEKSGDLTHTNEQFHVFKNRGNREITLGNCLFTADNEENARYALAAIHFFRSYSMMDYGQGKTARPPSPMWFSAFGPMGFQRLPVLLTGWSIQWDGNTNDLVSIGAVAPNPPPSAGTFARNKLGTSSFSSDVQRYLSPEDLAMASSATEAAARRYGFPMDGTQQGSGIAGRVSDAASAVASELNRMATGLLNTLTGQGTSERTAQAVVSQVVAEQSAMLGLGVDVTNLSNGITRAVPSLPTPNSVGGGSQSGKVEDTWIPAKFEVTGIKLIVQHSPNWWKTAFSMEDYRSGKMLYEMEATAPDNTIGDISDSFGVLASDGNPVITRTGSTGVAPPIEVGDVLPTASNPTGLIQTTGVPD